MPAKTHNKYILRQHMNISSAIWNEWVPEVFSTASKIVWRVVFNFGVNPVELSGSVYKNPLN